MKAGIKISINIAWAKRVKKAVFIKNLSKAYPDLDLGAIHDEINGKVKKELPRSEDLVG